MELEIDGDRSAHIEDWGHPPNEFFDRSFGEQFRTIDEQLPLILLEGKFPDDRSDDRTSGLSPTVENEKRFRNDLSLIPLSTALFGRAPDRDEVVLGLSPTLSNEFHHGASEFHDGVLRALRKR